MRERANEFILKLVGIAAVFTFLYPVVLTARLQFFARSGGLPAFCQALFAILPGFAAGILMYRNGSRFYHKLMALCGVTVPVLVFLLFQYGMAWTGLIFEIPVLLLFYFTGMNGWRNAYILSSNTPLTAGSILLGLCLLVNDATQVHGGLMLCVYTFIILSAILVSQRNINRIFIHQNTNLSVMIRGMRRFNVLIALLLVAVIFVSFNLKKIMLFFLTEVKNAVLKALIFIWKLISKLFPESKAPGSKGGGQPQLPVQEPGSENSLLNWIFVIIACLVCLYILYKTIPLLWRKAKQIAFILLKWLQKLLKTQRLARPAESEEYFDEVEQITRRQDTKKQKGPRLLRRNLRLYAKISDPVQKVRYLYGLILEGLADKAGDFQHSDTPGEILEKTRKYPAAIPFLSDMTFTYEKVRYDDTIPDEKEILKAEAACRKLLEVLQEKRYS